MMENPTWRLAYRTALKLGYYDVDAMLEGAPAGTLRKWGAYYEKEPYGDEWHQMSAGVAAMYNLVMMLLAALGSDKDKVDPKDFVPTDQFVPKPSEEVEEYKPLPKTPMEILAIARMQCGGV
jgi:hypothetical protein